MFTALFNVQTPENQCTRPLRQTVLGLEPLEAGDRVLEAGDLLLLLVDQIEKVEDPWGALGFRDVG
jgi:hypothetical protein